jgi:mRNA-degrading endonuclease toxin of MazEF toxin-antitoxin module
VKGDVVVVPFPFSDLSGSKRRPALILAELRGDDIILCQITTRARAGYAIDLVAQDFESGGLLHDSEVRPDKLFTAKRRLILSVVGRLYTAKLSEIVQRAVRILADGQ